MSSNKKANKMSVFTQIRTKTGMSQGELARCLGVTNVTISRWENGASEPLLSFKQMKVLSYILLGMGFSIIDLPEDPFGDIHGLDIPKNETAEEAEEKVLLKT
jgi:transcriptional regulator with XRE-family HTH domain